MWSRKPTPVSRAPSPVPSSASATLTSVSPVLRSIAARAAHVLLIVADPDLHRLRVELEALGAGDRRGGARERVVIGDAHLGEHAAEVLGSERRGEARRAARGQRVVRAGDVVAEGGAGTDEEAARVGDARGQLLGQRAEQLEVLGSERLRELERVLVSRARGPAGRSPRCPAGSS